MIMFFERADARIFTVQTSHGLNPSDIDKLLWLFDCKTLNDKESLHGHFVGPRASMITPWSTNAVEITQNMGISHIIRIEEFISYTQKPEGYDPMLLQYYEKLDQHIFDHHGVPEPVKYIEEIGAYNESEGLALSKDEITYLENIAKKYGRLLTDSEVFGFSQVNSEHCRHKIFNGTFIIDGEEKEDSLFKLIKKTSAKNPQNIVSAYKDNVAFIKGPVINQFAPESGDRPSVYKKILKNSVLSLKAETHNFPTTVEPFNGAATGSGGEIRDRLAGGQGSLPLAGTAVYITSYPRTEEGKPWEKNIPPRKWLYQSPLDILIKASNGASDFGNKFGQPLICGALLTFEHLENQQIIGYDKVIMLAGGIGYGYAEMAEKKIPSAGDKIILLGGDNYRIGMGGAAVSSADTGVFSSAIELNAIQRSNPEMQKRVANTIRAMVEGDENSIISIHDHGAGGHLNCLSELVEHTGGIIDMDKLPVGDPTLSLKEIIGNESQERMGLVIAEENVPMLKKIAERERAPIYVIGDITDDHKFSFLSKSQHISPINFAMDDFFGSSPKFFMHDTTQKTDYKDVIYRDSEISNYITLILQLESVACKDWLTNKVDRCVGGRVAVQQCSGVHQLPLNNCGVMAIDYDHHKGIATSIGQAPLTALIDAGHGSVQAIGEALTNIIWAPLENGIRSVSLSANWMWPCKNPGEDARLYEAVKACSEFAIALGINIPTGKDSLSMKQKYPDSQEVLAPGTVIISAAGSCSDIRKVVEPPIQDNGHSLYYINLSGDEYKLGGSSLAQILSAVGTTTPYIKNAAAFARAFDTIQSMIHQDLISSGHDISSGGMITALFEMAFSTNNLGLEIDLSDIIAPDIIHLLFSENTGIIFQCHESGTGILEQNGIKYHRIGEVTRSGKFNLKACGQQLSYDVAAMRKLWYKTSWLMDQHQSGTEKALERYENHDKFPLQFQFPVSFSGKKEQFAGTKPKAAVIREKGSNSEREMAHALYLAGFEVRDVHMTDLMNGRETLEDVHFIGAVGGFSNSDVLGSAKGWAGAFLYNEKAKNALHAFFNRPDTLSVGICNGCQLFIELGLIYPEHDIKPKMLYNDTGKHESGFVAVEIPQNHSVMMSSLSGTNLGVWISHGEGKFHLPKSRDQYHIVATYKSDKLPANPNGSDYNAAMMCSHDGRHLVMMPHIERSVFPWNWAYYPSERKSDEVSPWLEAFVNARKWIETRIN